MCARERVCVRVRAHVRACIACACVRSTAGAPLRYPRTHLCAAHQVKVVQHQQGRRVGRAICHGRAKCRQHLGQARAHQRSTPVWVGHHTERGGGRERSPMGRTSDPIGQKACLRAPCMAGTCAQHGRHMYACTPHVRLYATCTLVRHMYACTPHVRLYVRHRHGHCRSVGTLATQVQRAIAVLRWIPWLCANGPKLTHTYTHVGPHTACRCLGVQARA